MIASFDCGVRGCGVALFAKDATLFRAMYVPNPIRHGQGIVSAIALADAVRWSLGPLPLQLLTDIAIETMRVYDAGNQKGDQNDLLGVQLVAGAIVGNLSAERPLTLRSYQPSDWKGTIDGDTCTQRIIDRLSEKERSMVELFSEALDHNTWDAVGVGLKYLGRFEPRRIFARE